MCSIAGLPERETIRDQIPHPAGDADPWQIADPAAPGIGFRILTGRARAG